MYGFDHRKVRPATNRLIDMMDEGLIDARAVADMALSWLSESDVAEMMKANDLVEYDEDEDEYDGQPDEAQEWHDFDPEC
jgi:cobalamin biosynthesis protein CobT